MNARKYKRPWQRVSLRTFLLVLVGGGVLFGITAKRAREQRRAVLATQSLGAVILYDTMRDELRKWNVINNGRSRNSVRPRFRTGPDSLKSQLSRSGVTAKTSLMRKLFGNDLFDRVVVVDLHNCNFAGEQLHYLSGFPRLEALYLNSSNVTDEDLAYLSGLSNLRTLALSSTEITDAGIEHLLKLKRLESVHLDRTYVTNHGIRKLQQEIPNCNIISPDSYGVQRKIPGFSSLKQWVAVGMPMVGASASLATGREGNGEHGRKYLGNALPLKWTHWLCCQRSG